jgi:hypothetical protein
LEIENFLPQITQSVIVIPRKTYLRSKQMIAGVNAQIWLIMAVLLLNIASANPPPKIIYVDADANGLNNGSGWADAYNYLQDALADVNSEQKPVEIRVAAGVYKPDRSSAEPNGIGDRKATFQLINGVTIKGGYASPRMSLSGADPNARDIKLYETILSGDLAGNDELTDPSYLLYEESRQENSYHVLAGSGTDSSSVLSGCTIVGGQAYSEEFQYLNEFCYGGGLHIISGSPVILNCTFKSNAALEYGGSIHIDNDSAPSIVGCIFNENSATDGGGMNSDYSSPTITKCLFIGNTACSYNADGGSGAGMYNYESQSTINSCMFIGNSSDEWGVAGGMCNNKSTVTINNCIFAYNSSGYVGGLLNGWSNLTLTNCTFHRNNSREGPGAIRNNPYTYNAYIKNCILWGDTPNEISGENLSVSYSDVQGGWPDEGNIDKDLCFAAPGNWDPNGTPDDEDDFWVDPVWVDGDYHLKSQAGRWDPKSQNWVKDNVTSPCIDAGDPHSPIGLEPFPNGGIINMGAYGGTAEASKSYFGEPVCETIVAGDINGDCIVDFKDFAIMSYHWLEEH